MFGNNKDSKSEFVRQAQLERQKRLELKKQSEHVVKIQVIHCLFLIFFLESWVEIRYMT